MSITNIIICGVGGQGIILSSKILALAALENSYDVKQSEVHGMAQRGGSVISHIRFGEKIYSPIIEEKTADIILGFEKMETARYMNYLKKDGLVICNNMKIKPVNIEKYPETEIDEIFKNKKILFIDAVKFCEALGFKNGFNIFLLGVLSNYIPISNEIFEKVIKKIIKSKYIELNLNAYFSGRKEGLICSGIKNPNVCREQN